MSLYSIVLDVAGKLAVVVGGGPVGCRKAARLAHAGARVRLVSRDLPLQQMGDVIVEEYRRSHLEGAALVFAAASPEVNRQVVADAKALGIWVNSADDPCTGDFIVPAVVERGDLTLAISTGGSSPAVARQLRQLLENQFDDAWADWLKLQRRLRDHLLNHEPAAAVRKHLFEQLADLSWVERVRHEDGDSVWQAMMQVVKQHRGTIE